MKVKQLNHGHIGNTIMFESESVSNGNPVKGRLESVQETIIDIRLSRPIVSHNVLYSTAAMKPFLKRRIINGDIIIVK